MPYVAHQANPAAACKEDSNSANNSSEESLFPTSVMNGDSDKKRHSVLQVIGVVILYWTISITMVFANKYLVGNQFNKQDLSIAVAWAQCLITVCVAILLSLFRRRVLHQSDAELPSLNRAVVLHRDFLILSSSFTIMLIFNNLTLKLVGVAFFQVARSMTLIFTVILSAILLRQFASIRVIFCCLLVAAGFVLGVDQEKLLGTLNIAGIMYGLITSTCVAFTGIFTKRLLQLFNNSSIAVTFSMNVGASVLLIPLLLASGQFMPLVSNIWSDIWFLPLLICSGLLGFMINWASNMQIDYTSPISHHISNNTKSVIQTILAVFFYHEMKTTLWWCSIMLVVVGAFLYTYVKMKEEKSAPPPSNNNEPKLIQKNESA